MKKIILLLIILLYISTVTATTFDVTTDINTGSICPSNTVLYTFTIQNTGTSKQEYTFSESGSASPWSTIVPVGYILQPQESKLIYVYITPPKTTLPGVYNLNILINNQYSTKTVNFETIVNDCYKTSIISTTKTSCINDDVNLDFSITNNGDYDQTYSLKASSPLPSSISQDSVYIPSKTSKTVSIFTKPERKGEYEVVLSAKSQDSTASSTAVLIVESCFDYNLLLEKNFIETCDHTTIIIPITIENIGNENVFSLELQGPTWSKLETSSLSIPKNSNKQTNIIISPDYGIEGSFTFTITADNKETKKQQQLTLNVIDCHQAELKISKNQDKICRSLSNNYDIILRNTGEFTEQYKLSLEGVSWADLDKDLLTLNKQEEASINLNVYPGKDTETKDYQINIKAESIESQIQTQDTINLQIISEIDCYKPLIQIERPEVNLNPDSTATIPITIENKGSEIATYNLEISGTATSFTQLNPSTITIQPQKAEFVYLYIAPSSTIKDGSYTLTVSARLKDSGILNSDEVNINIGKQFKVPIVEKDKLKLDKVTNFLKKYFLPIIIIIVLILLSILGFKSGLFSSLFSEDKETKKEKPIKKETPIKKEEKIKEEYITDYWKIIRYIIILILIIAAIILIIKYFSFISPYRWYILVGIIILVVFLLILKIKSIKPVIDFFEEEPVKKEAKPVKKEIPIKKEEKIKGKTNKEKMNILWWILGIIILIGLVFIVWKFNIFVYMVDYKFYILGAFVVLTIIILVLRYWQGLINFFEEEEDDKKEVIKKREEGKKERDEYY